jgi:hypothetical protein
MMQKDVQNSTPDTNVSFNVKIGRIGKGGKEKMGILIEWIYWLDKDDNKGRR